METKYTKREAIEELSQIAHDARMLECKISHLVRKCEERRMSGFVYELHSFSQGHAKNIETNADRMRDILLEANDWNEDVQYWFCEHCGKDVPANHSHWN